MLSTTFTGDLIISITINFIVDSRLLFLILVKNLESILISLIRLKTSTLFIPDLVA